MRRLLLIALLALAVSACQLVDPPDQAATGEVGTADGLGAESDDLLGNPEDEWPTTLAGLLALVRPEALLWQDAPVLADLTVWFAPPGVLAPSRAVDTPTAAPRPDAVPWARVRLTFVAAGADRMLTVRATPDRLSLQRPRLAGLALPELPPQAVEQMESLPAGVLEPHALAHASRGALAQCDDDGDPVVAVLYATGAPAAWNPEAGQWDPVPTWRATVLTETVGVSVDPTSGTAFAPLTCVEPLAPEA